MVKILFTDTEQGQIPPSFAIETSMANTRVEIAFDSKDTEKATINTPLNTEAETLTTPETIAKLRKLLAINHTHHATHPVEQAIAQVTPVTTATIAKTIENEQIPIDSVVADNDNDIAISENITTSPASATTVVCGGDENIVKKAATESPLTLPKAISEDNVNACNNHFKTLSREQQQKVLQVFDYNLKTRTINNPAGYFITLARAAKVDGLTVPSESFVTTPRSKKKKAADKDKLRRIELWSEYTWLQDHAEREKIAMDVLAKQMGEKSEAAYAMYGGKQGTVTELVSL